MTTATAETATRPETADLVALALRLGDDTLVLGQRYSEWVGHAPALELEMAVSNLALDLIGEAQLWLDCAGRLEGKGRDADKLAYLRDVLDFTNLLLVEQPNHDWAYTVLRHYLYSVYHRLLVEGLVRAPEPAFAEIASKVLPEVRYHVKFAHSWVLRLGDGTEESHRRLQAALDRLWRFTGEMFVDDELAARLEAAGFPPLASGLKPAWDEEVGATLKEAGVTPPQPRQMITGGRIGHHGEHLGHLLAELQFLQRAYPGCEW